MGGVDLLREVWQCIYHEDRDALSGILTGTDRHDAHPQVTRVEVHITPEKMNSGEAAFELDVALSLALRLGALQAVLDDFRQHFLDLLDAEHLR